MRICQCFGQSMVEIIGLSDPDEVIVFVEAQDEKESIMVGAWTQLTVTELFRLPVEKPDIGTIDKVFVEVKKVSTRLVNTPIGPSPTKENEEGTRLTGQKLVFEGMLEQKAVYTAAKPDQPVFTVHFVAPFSAFLTLAEDAELKEVSVDVCVEDIFAIPFNPREIFKSVTLFLQAIPFKEEGRICFE